MTQYHHSNKAHHHHAKSMRKHNIPILTLGPTSQSIIYIYESQKKSYNVSRLESKSTYG